MTDQTPADKFRDLLRRDLQAAMKARHRDEVSILRVLIGAIDNAEAEDLTTLAPSGGSSGHVAGGRAGAGSTEVARRRLSSADLQQILVDEVTALTDQATHYEAAGEHEKAAHLRAQAHFAARFRSTDPQDSPIPPG